MDSQEPGSATSQPTSAPSIQDNSAKSKAKDRTGQQLGNYRLIHLLAAGGFAEVYLAEHIHLNTYAAIKVLQTQLATEDLAQFREEARIVARLRHPHIVSVLDFNVEQETPFLVMDYAPNGTLRQCHPRGSILQPDLILSYIRQVGDALDYAHSQRLIHRDIKPENMLIGARNEILLSDFGVAIVAQTSHSSITQDIIGTVTYMAPEQLRGKPHQASDQYALAVIIYEWLCGNIPFTGSMAEIMAQHLNAQPPSLIQRNPAISPAIEQVVMRALSKDLEQRYPTVQAFIAAFEEANQQQPLYLQQFIAPTQAVTPHLQEHFAPTVLVASPEKVPSGKAKKTTHVSRRTFVFGMVGAAALGLTSGGIFLIVRLVTGNRNMPPPSTPTATSTSSTQAIGTTYHTYRGHSDTVSSLAWSPDDSYIISGSLDRTTQIWDTSTGGVNATTDSTHTDAVNTVGWSPDGKYAASGSADRTVLVLDTSTQKVVSTFSGHTDTVNALAWSPDSTTIASASSDTTVQLWTASTAQGVNTYKGHSSAVNAVAYSPGGTLIASGGADNLVQVWDLTVPNGKLLYTFQGHIDQVWTLTWSPDGKYIASGSADKTVQVWEALTGNVVYTYKGHNDVVLSVSWSSNNQTIASGSVDKTVQLWQPFANGNLLFTYQNHQSDVRAVAWSADGTLIASGSADKTVQIWQAT